MGGKGIAHSEIRSLKSRGGVTLLEVLVALGAAAVVFGIALGILVTTNKTANDTLKRQWLIQQAQLDMRRIRSVLEGIVWSEDLASPPPANAAVVFAKDGLAVLSSHRPTTAGRFCHYTLGYKKDVGGEKPNVPGLFRRIPGAAGAPEFQALGGDFEATVDFRYATTVKQDFQAEWKESLGPGEKPRLIWLQLILRNPAQIDRHQIDLLLETYDENKDGKIDKDEQQKKKMPESSAVLWDHNKDGVIEAEEVVESVQLTTAIAL